MPQLGQVYLMVLVTKNTERSHDLDIIDQIGQGRLIILTPPLNAKFDNLWALVTKRIGHPLQQVK